MGQRVVRAAHVTAAVERARRVRVTPVDEAGQRRVEALRLLDRHVLDRQRRVERAVEHQRPHVLGIPLRVERADERAVREAHVREPVVAERGPQHVEVLHRVGGRDVPQQIAAVPHARVDQVLGRLLERRELGRRRRATSRCANRASRFGPQSTGLLLPAPRGSHATMSNRSVIAFGQLRRRRSSTRSRPDAPGPPGFTSRLPIRRPGAAVDAARHGEVDAAALRLRVVERHGERRALALARRRATRSGGATYPVADRRRGRRGGRRRGRRDGRGAASDPEDAHAVAASARPRARRARPRRGRTGAIAAPLHSPSAGARCTPGRAATLRGMDLLIGGTARPAADGGTLDVFEPASGDVLTTIASGTAADADAAVTAARAAFDAGVWSGLSATARGKVLLRVAALIRDRAEELATLEARNAGKPIGDARWEVNAAADVFEYYAGAANKLFGEVVPVQDDGLDVVLREPVGVCALIVPWNFPLLITTWKTAPALACGNAVIIKPASLTPLTALRLGEILVEAGVPEGCVSVVPGPGRRRRRRAGERSARRQDRVHRRDRHRRRDPARELRQHHPRLARARRQVGVRRVRRRRLGARRRRDPDVRVRQRGPGLLRPQPHRGARRRSTTTSSPRSPGPPRRSPSGPRSTTRPRSAR